MTKTKKIVIIVASIAVISVVAVFCGVYFGIYFVPGEKQKSAEFVKDIEECTFYQNGLNDALSQADTYSIMYNHMYSNTSGKTPKLLFIGYDGYLASAFKLRENAADSAAFYIGKEGSMYLTRTGGKEVGQQKTKTAPGWATLFTGVWNDVHKVNGNNSTLTKDVKSLPYLLAESNFNASFSVSWKKHFTVTYKHEVKAAKSNNLPIDYNYSNEDDGTVEHMLNDIDEGKDAIFGILEYTDHAGHGSSYSLSDSEYVEAVHSADSEAYKLIKRMESRATYNDEDWLVIISSDHGGVLNRHGQYTIMEYTSFLISNKVF